MQELDSRKASFGRPFPSFRQQADTLQATALHLTNLSGTFDSALM